MYWGYSPALDLQTEWEQRGLSGSTDELRILIVGASDGRHILKTLARSHSHANRKLIFHVMEGSLELMARQMMFLTVALEPSQVLGLHEKTRLFLDIYGNILVRPNSARYVADKATQLIHMVTDPDYRQARMPLLRLDRLKYKERDHLENIFKFWQKDGNNIFHPRAHWDSRLRRHLGTRYDSKEGIFDWDYHMRLRPLGGERINSREYKHWRGTGVAFTWPETECSKPNCTLASGVVLIGDRLCHHGYLGDIVSGPHVNYGIECEDEDMLRKTNGVHNKRSTDIAERNLMRLFSELQTRQPYVHRPTLRESDRPGVVITEMVDHQEVSSDQEDPRQRSGDKETYSAIPVESVEVIFHPSSAVVDYPVRGKLKGYFDVMFLSQSMSDSFNEKTTGLARDGALVLVESRLFVVGMREKDLSEFGETIGAAARVCLCEPSTEFDPKKHPVARFVVQRTRST